MEAAVAGRHAYYLGGRRLALPMLPKCIFHSRDAVVECQQRRNLVARQQQNTFGRHALLPASEKTDSELILKSCKFEPGNTSTGTQPRRKTRAIASPRKIVSPLLTRSMPGSRRPTTGKSFSSRYCMMRSSWVSPMWVEFGSGSR